LSQTRSCIAAANTELTTAAERVRAAETRASAAAAAVREIEQAIRTQFFGFATDMSIGGNGADHPHPPGPFMPEYPRVAY